MEISLKPIKRYIRYSIIDAQKKVSDYYINHYDPIYGWRIGKLIELDIIKEISNIKNGIDTKIKDELTLKKLGLLNEVINEYYDKINEIDWRIIRNEFEIRQKHEYEKLYGKVGLPEEGVIEKDNRGNIKEKEYNKDLEEYEIINEDFKLIKSLVQKGSDKLEIIGNPKIDLRFTDEKKSICSLTYINTQIDSKQLALLNYIVSQLLKSHTQEIIKIEIKSINNINYLQASFIL